MSSLAESDRIFMRRAAALALNGERGAHPNPLVGCVIVKKGRIIGEGWHRSFGGAHAEVNAINSCRCSIRGATLYVTLEPCSTHGKTPPCTEAIIKAAPARVVIGARDPAPANGGRAAGILSAAGIKVRKYVLQAQCAALNPVFNKFMRTGLPFVTLKIAQSLDGKIADSKGRSRWISGPVSRLEAHRLRAASDAVLAGINTVLKDDPLLNARGVALRRQPCIVILDSSLRIKPGSRVFSNKRVLIATTNKAATRTIKKLSADNVRVLVLPGDCGGRVSLPALLRELGAMGVAHLMVEGGASVTGSFLSQGLADRLICFVSPLAIGGEGARSSVVWSDSLIKKSRDLGIRVKLTGFKQSGDDLMTEYSLSCSGRPELLYRKR